VAYTLGIIAQRHTPAAEAALIMCLESVFAAITGAILLHEHLTPLAMAGCGLILLGVIIVEVGPGLVKRYTSYEKKRAASAQGRPLITQISLLELARDELLVHRFLHQIRR
jgi:hypothetical protein